MLVRKNHDLQCIVASPLLTLVLVFTNPNPDPKASYLGCHTVFRITVVVDIKPSPSDVHPFPLPHR